VLVLNATHTSLLATNTSADLQARGFQTVSPPGNATSLYDGVAIVRYNQADDADGAREIAAQVQGSVLEVGTSQSGGIELVLGSQYSELASPYQVAAAEAPYPDPACGSTGTSASTSVSGSG